MPAFTLAELQTAATSSYTDFEFKLDENTTLRFHAILRRDFQTRQAYALAMDLEERLKDALREALAQEDINDADDFDVIDLMIQCYKDSFRIVAHTPEDFEQLDAALKVAGPNGELYDDIGLWEAMTARYKKVTEPEKA